MLAHTHTCLATCAFCVASERVRGKKVPWHNQLGRPAVEKTQPPLLFHFLLFVAAAAAAAATTTAAAAAATAAAPHRQKSVDTKQTDSDCHGVGWASKRMSRHRSN